MYGTNQRPEASVAQRFGVSTLRIFNKTQAVGEGLYSKSSYIGQVVMLSSNGWGVTYMPDFTPSRSSSFDVVNNNGVSYDIEKTLFDAKTGFVYFKFLGNDFRVMSFPDWNLLDSGSEVWSVHEGEWKFRIIGDQESILGSPFVSDRDTGFLNIEPSFYKDGIVLTEQGHLLGFVDSSDVLHSAWSIEHHMPFVLGLGQLDDFVSTWQGYMVYNNNTDASDSGPDAGFYVTSVGAYPRGLRVGDIILNIEGKKLSENTLSRELFSASQEFVLTVWRKAQEFDIIITK